MNYFFCGAGVGVGGAVIREHGNSLFVVTVNVVIIEETPESNIGIQSILECEVLRHVIHLCQIILTLIIKASCINFRLVPLKDVDLEPPPKVLESPYGLLNPLLALLGQILDSILPSSLHLQHQHDTEQRQHI